MTTNLHSWLGDIHKGYSSFSRYMNCEWYCTKNFQTLQISANIKHFSNKINILKSQLIKQLLRTLYYLPDKSNLKVTHISSATTQFWFITEYISAFNVCYEKLPCSKDMTVKENKIFSRRFHHIFHSLTKVELWNKEKKKLAENRGEMNEAISRSY